MSESHTEIGSKGALLKGLTSGLTVAATLLLLISPAEIWGVNGLISSVNIQVVIDGDRLSVFTQNADLEDILNEISRKTHIKFNVPTPIKTKVSVEFTDLPFDLGLKRILKRQNYIFLYTAREADGDSKTRSILSQVIVVEKSSSGLNSSMPNFLVSEKNDRAESDPKHRLPAIQTDLIERLSDRRPSSGRGILESIPRALRSRLELTDAQAFKSLQEKGLEKNKHHILKELERFLEQQDINKRLDVD